MTLLFKMDFGGELLKAVAERLVTFKRRILGEQFSRFFARRFDEFRISERSHSQIGQAGLARADKVARSADGQVFFSQLKAVVAFQKRFQAPI